MIFLMNDCQCVSMTYCHIYVSTFYLDLNMNSNRCKSLFLIFTLILRRYMKTDQPQSMYEYFSLYEYENMWLIYADIVCSDLR
jgi:hypothetical protein